MEILGRCDGRETRDVPDAAEEEHPNREGRDVARYRDPGEWDAPIEGEPWREWGQGVISGEVRGRRMYRARPGATTSSAS